MTSYSRAVAMRLLSGFSGKNACEGRGDVTYQFCASNYTCYMERPTGGVRGAFGFLVREGRLSNRGVSERFTILWHGSLPVIVYENQRMLSLMAVITTSGSERWCYLENIRGWVRESVMIRRVGIGGHTDQPQQTMAMGQIWATVS